MEQTYVTPEQRAKFAIAFDVGVKAKAKGYAVQASKAKLRFVTIRYDDRGVGAVTPVSEWCEFEQAESVLEGLK